MFQLKEAIEMLEIRMLKVERVQPVAINYNILIGACGRVGYTKMAFKLFNNVSIMSLDCVIRFEAPFFSLLRKLISSLAYYNI